MASVAASVTAAQCAEVKIALAGFYDGVSLSEDERFTVSDVLFQKLFREVEYLMTRVISGGDNWWINDLYDAFVDSRW